MCQIKEAEYNKVENEVSFHYMQLKEIQRQIMDLSGRMGFENEIGMEIEQKEEELRHVQNNYESTMNQLNIAKEFESI